MQLRMMKAILMLFVIGSSAGSPTPAKWNFSASEKQTNFCEGCTSVAINNGGKQTSEQDAKWQFNSEGEQTFVMTSVDNNTQHNTVVVGNSQSHNDPRSTGINQNLGIEIGSISTINNNEDGNLKNLGASQKRFIGTVRNVGCVGAFCSRRPVPAGQVVLGNSQDLKQQQAPRINQNMDIEIGSIDVVNANDEGNPTNIQTKTHGYKNKTYIDTIENVHCIGAFCNNGPVPAVHGSKPQPAEVTHSIKIGQIGNLSCHGSSCDQVQVWSTNGMNCTQKITNSGIFIACNHKPETSSVPITRRKKFASTAELFSQMDLPCFPFCNV